MKLSFSKFFGAAFLLLLLTEVLIARFVHDDFVRPFVGDYLVTILIYCFVRTWLQGRARLQLAGVLLFCYAVEFGQKFRLVQILGLEHNRLARIVIGSHYDVRDLLAYSLAALTLLLLSGRWWARSRGATVR